MITWIEQLFKDEKMLKKGHLQSAKDLNLGMGWLYYGLTRLIKPRRIVVIGSYRGYSPLVFGKALIDNGENGRVLFIDPSLVDDFWKDPKQVSEHFASFQVDCIDHFLLTTQEFVTTPTYHSLSDIGIVFIDGYHSEEQVRFDFEAFESKIAPQGIFLFHDSIETKTTPIYGENKIYKRGVKLFIDTLKQRLNFQVLDLNFAKGLTIVRISGEKR